MDLNTVETIESPARRQDLPAHRPGDAWLGGGTWLYSEPQTGLRRVIDLAGMDWPPVVVSDQGLEIAATCTIATLEAAVLPASWTATALVGQCCRALLASFKVWNMATVGGNICLALPAGSMTALAVALDGAGTVWSADGTDRAVAIVDLVTGNNRTALRPGELLRRIDLPAAALRRRTAYRQVSLTRHGRSGALLIGTLDAAGGFALTVTAATPRPVQIRLPTLPDAAGLVDAIDAAIPAAGYFDDMHGAPDWRRHVTRHLAEGIRLELAA